MEDLTDNEREEQLRRWWGENWFWIVGGIVLGLGLLAGWQYWQRMRTAAAERDAGDYVAVVEALGRNDRDQAIALAEALRKRHPESAYSDQAELVLARAAIDRREFDDAAGRLRRVADGSRDPELRLVAKTRLARVLLEQGKPDEALGLLDPAGAGAFAPRFREIRGDAFAAKGDAAAARAEYDAVLAADGTQLGIDREFVELKRADLPAGSPAPSPGVADK